MRSRWTWTVVLAVLAALGVVGWATRAPTRPRPRAFDARLGRAAIERFFADTRSGALPKLDVDGLPVPWGVEFTSDEHRRAWGSYLATVAPRLAALDALHDDPNVRALLLEGDGAPILADLVRMWEASALVSELAASAELALDRGDVETTLRRSAQALEVGLLFRDDSDGENLLQNACIVRIAASLESLMQPPRWSASQAFVALAAPLRSLVEDQARALGPGCALGRRVRAARFGFVSDESTVATSLSMAGVVEEAVERSIAVERVLLLALAADAFRAEHGRWPASTSELSNLLDADELECPLVEEPLDLAPDGPNLRVGLIHSKRPPREFGTTRLLVR